MKNEIWLQKCAVRRFNNLDAVELSCFEFLSVEFHMTNTLVRT